MKSVIEREGIIYGPFATDREAADWALSHCATPWDRSMSFRCSKSDRGKTDGQK